VNAHDERSDNEVLRAASESLSAIPMASPPDVEAILARGRAVRARRRIPGAFSGLAMVTAAAVVLGLGLSGAFGSAAAAPARGTGTIQTASFTLVKHANGTVTLAANPGVLLDAAALRNALHQDGIPALVTSGSFCTSNPPLAAFSQVVSWRPGLGHNKGGGSFAVANADLTINPAAIAAGTELSFGVFQLSADHQLLGSELINTNSYSCTSTAPSPPLVDGTIFQLLLHSAGS
jgi:hypothetical protein